ncbi:hypothetical protein [Sphingomonas sp. 4RDLI-65]|uniref:hypothetical protein n=1 Tax=Sphingomonas sp. 4RDLI-65 TaxID=3111641 RepID=UPI003C30AB8B
MYRNAAFNPLFTTASASYHQIKRSGMMGQALRLTEMVPVDTGRIDAMIAVKADLAARIAAIDVRAPYSRPCDIATEIDAIRVIAHSNGLNPAVTVAHFVDSALSRGENGALVHGWLAILRDAVGCERQDVQACHAFAAACSVRLAG